MRIINFIIEKYQNIIDYLNIDKSLNEIIDSDLTDNEKLNRVSKLKNLDLDVNYFDIMNNNILGCFVKKDPFDEKRGRDYIGKIVKIIFSKLPDKTRFLEHTNLESMTALAVAVDNDDIIMVEALIEAGANVNFKVKNPIQSSDDKTIASLKELSLIDLAIKSLPSKSAEKILIKLLDYNTQIDNKMIKNHYWDKFVASKELRAQFAMRIRFNQNELDQFIDKAAELDNAHYLPNLFQSSSTYLEAKLQKLIIQNSAPNVIRKISEFIANHKETGLKISDKAPHYHLINGKIEQKQALDYMKHNPSCELISELPVWLNVDDKYGLKVLDQLSSSISYYGYFTSKLEHMKFLVSIGANPYIKNISGKTSEDILNQNNNVYFFSMDFKKPLAKIDYLNKPKTICKDEILLALRPIQEERNNIELQLNDEKSKLESKKNELDTKRFKSNSSFYSVFIAAHLVGYFSAISNKSKIDFDHNDFLISMSLLNLLVSASRFKNLYQEDISNDIDSKKAIFSTLNYISKDFLGREISTFAITLSLYLMSFIDEKQEYMIDTCNFLANLVFSTFLYIALDRDIHQDLANSIVNKSEDISTKINPVIGEFTPMLAQRTANFNNYINLIE